MIHSVIKVLYLKHYCIMDKALLIDKMKCEKKLSIVILYILIYKHNDTFFNIYHSI